MTVGELKAKLNTYPDDMDVVINVSEDAYEGFHYEPYLAASHCYTSDITEARIEILDCLD